MLNRLFLACLLATSMGAFFACSDVSNTPVVPPVAEKPSAQSSKSLLAGSETQEEASEGDLPEAIVANSPVVAADDKASEAVEEEVKSIVESLQKAKTLNGVLGYSSQLSDLGKPAYPAVKSHLEGAKGLAKVAILRALYFTSRDNSELDAAISDLTAVASGKEEREVRLAAAELLEHLASPRHAKKLAKALDDSFDTPVRIALAIALWNTAKEEKAISALKDLLNSDSESSQLQAAIALGKTSHFAVAQDYLRILANEPTIRGMTAKELISRERLDRKLLSKVTGSVDDEPINVDLTTLEHIIDMIGERYIHQEKVGRTRLKEKAAEGLLEGMDPYCAYLDETQAKRIEEVRQFAVPSLGISLGAVPLADDEEQREKDGFRVPTVIAVDPGSAADRAGIRPGDMIVSLAPNVTMDRVFEWREGASARHDETVMDFLSMPLDTKIEKMRGRKGTRLGINIRRHSWDLNRWIVLEHHEPISKDNSLSVLDGGVLYAQVHNFDSNAKAFFEEIYQKLEDKEAHKGLLIDLRSCSGGVLGVAASCAELFLRATEPTSYSFGRNTKVVPVKLKQADHEKPNLSSPIGLLVGGGTSDAAEVFAAALQDNQRAKLYGDPTFGRTIIQKVLPLKAKGSKHALLLTVGKHYTPLSKRRIMYRGLSPDVRVHNQVRGDESVRDIKDIGGQASLPRYGSQGVIEGWVLDELDILSRNQRLEKYLDRISENKELAKKLATRDQGVDYDYPGFETFYKGVTAPEDIHLNESHIKRALRRMLRQKLADAGENLGVDIQEDLTFCTALGDLARSNNIDLSSYEQYKGFVNSEKFKEGKRD